MTGKRHWRSDGDGLPTARTTLRTSYVRVLLTCRSCRHQRDADFAALIAAGRGDTPAADPGQADGAAGKANGSFGQLQPTFEGGAYVALSRFACDTAHRWVRMGDDI